MGENQKKLISILMFLICFLCKKKKSTKIIQKGLKMLMSNFNNVNKFSLKKIILETFFYKSLEPVSPQALNYFLLFITQHARFAGCRISPPQNWNNPWNPRICDISSQVPAPSASTAPMLHHPATQPHKQFLFGPLPLILYCPSRQRPSQPTLPYVVEAACPLCLAHSREDVGEGGKGSLSSCLSPLWFLSAAGGGEEQWPGCHKHHPPFLHHEPQWKHFPSSSSKSSSHCLMCLPVWHQQELAPWGSPARTSFSWCCLVCGGQVWRGIGWEQLGSGSIT